MWWLPMGEKFLLKILAPRSQQIREILFYVFSCLHGQEVAAKKLTMITIGDVVGGPLQLPDQFVLHGEV